MSEGESAEISLDLNRTRTIVTRRGDALAADGLPEGDQLPRPALDEVELREGWAYRWDGEAFIAGEIRGQRYTRLVPTVDAPAMTIDGISMHIARKDSPWRTTRRMAEAVRPSGKRVLDCCSGLGYVAMHALALGATNVLTFETCDEVLALRSLNPWSAGLADPRIDARHADILQAIGDLGDASFGAIVHDPPRISRRTGDLYGRPFYRELFRVLRPGGLLLHYLGRPGVTRGQLHTARVPDRLLEVGFVDARPIDDVQSLLLRKPAIYA